MDRYDVVTVGGGLAASALAKGMAERGARVLVVEREREFRDRVRGEALAPWGVAELEALGLLGALEDVPVQELHTWRLAVAGMTVAERPFAPTTLPGRNWLAFYHPDLQRACLDAAARAGAEVRRGVRVTGIRPGRTPAVALDDDGGREVAARIVVAADGRGSAARALAGFETRRDPEKLLFAGVWLGDVAIAPGYFHQFADPMRGRIAYVFPQPGRRARCYVGWNAAGGGVARLQGAAAFERFKADAAEVGVPPDAFAAARMAGPLATFDGADSWVEHPYRDGIALLGDAAATTDPTWGQGMSMALRDARVLHDALASTDDWDAAAHAWAAEHDRVYEIVHRADGWFAELFMDIGPEADARRARAFPLLAADPTRAVDVPSSGPESPCDETARRRFFAED